MSLDYYLGCMECRRKVHLGSLGILTPRLEGGDEAAWRILNFITKHQDCEGSVVAADDSRDWKDDAVDSWPDDQGEPTVREVKWQEHQRWLATQPKQPTPHERLEEVLRDHGYPVPTREEKAAIYAASGLPTCDPNRVTEGFERTADLLEPLRDPTLEPLQRPQEP